MRSHRTFLAWTERRPAPREHVFKRLKSYMEADFEENGATRPYATA